MSKYPKIENIAPSLINPAIQSISLVPSNIELPNIHLQDLELTALYKYNNIDGTLNMLIAYYQNQNGVQESRAFSYFYDPQNDQYSWRMKFPNNKWPIYGLDLLEISKSKRVIFCENEAAADFVNKLLPDYIGISMAGGLKSIDKSNLFSLKNRHILIWPRNNELHIKYANTLKERLLSVGAATCIILNFS